MIDFTFIRYSEKDKETICLKWLDNCARLSISWSMFQKIDHEYEESFRIILLSYFIILIFSLWFKWLGNFFFMLFIQIMVPSEIIFEKNKIKSIRNIHIFLVIFLIDP